MTEIELNMIYHSGNSNLYQTIGKYRNPLR